MHKRIGVRTQLLLGQEAIRKIHRNLIIAGEVVKDLAGKLED